MAKRRKIDNGMELLYLVSIGMNTNIEIAHELQIKPSTTFARLNFFVKTGILNKCNGLDLRYNQKKYYLTPLGKDLMEYLFDLEELKEKYPKIIKFLEEHY